MRRLLIVLGVLVLLALAVAGGGLYAIGRYNAPGPLAELQPVVVPHGTPAELAQALSAAGVINGTWAFRLAAALTAHEGQLRAGEFIFPAHGSLFATLTILRRGKEVQHRLTIPEGLTAAQIAEILDRAPALDGDTPVPAEGAVLPETYSYVRGTSRSVLLERGHAAMEKALAQVWASRDPALALTRPEDLLTLASIVERETSRPEERAHVAAVFLNRLKRGMRLQSDPTTAYAVSGGMTTYDHGLTRADLERANPYNTYTIAGLPPGPIDSPGLAAMQAVARPLASDDLYFVADGNGGHVFAKTLEDHNRNVAHWRALAVKP
jgi:UPF0755 protein